MGEVAIDTDVLASLELLSDGKVTAQFVGGDMNGWREVLAVPVGDYVLRTTLSAAPKQEQIVSIRVSKGARATATLRARSGVGSVRVRVDDAGGQPFNKFVTHLLREDMRVFAYPVLGDPRVIIDCDPGSYRVEVYDLLGRKLGTESISVLPGRAVDLGFSLNL